jgi:hypothetical protein
MTIKESWKSLPVCAKWLVGLSALAAVGTVVLGLADAARIASSTNPRDTGGAIGGMMGALAQAALMFWFVVATLNHRRYGAIGLAVIQLSELVFAVFAGPSAFNANFGGALLHISFLILTSALAVKTVRKFGLAKEADEVVEIAAV